MKPMSHLMNTDQPWVRHPESEINKQILTTSSSSLPHRSPPPVLHVHSVTWVEHSGINQCIIFINHHDHNHQQHLCSFPSYCSCTNEGFFLKCILAWWVWNHPGGFWCLDLWFAHFSFPPDVPTGFHTSLKELKILILYRKGQMCCSDLLCCMSCFCCVVKDSRWTPLVYATFRANTLMGNISSALATIFWMLHL